MIKRTGNDWYTIDNDFDIISLGDGWTDDEWLNKRITYREYLHRRGKCETKEYAEHSSPIKENVKEIEEETLENNEIVENLEEPEEHNTPENKEEDEISCVIM